MMSIKMIVSMAAAAQAIHLKADDNQYHSMEAQLLDDDAEKKEEAEELTCKEKISKAPWQTKQQWCLGGTFVVVLFTVPFVDWFHPEDSPALPVGGNGDIVEIPEGYLPEDVCNLASDLNSEGFSNSESCKVITNSVNFHNNAGDGAVVNLLELLPNLELVQGDLTFDNTEGLEVLSMTRDDDRMLKVDGNVVVTQNPDLQMLSFDALEHPHGLEVSGNAQLAEVNLSNLDFDAVTGAVNVGENAESCACNCPEQIGDVC